MRTLTVYEANDGSRWDDAANAMERDALICEAQAFLLSIGMKPRPTGTDFANGGGYVQQPKDALDHIGDWLREKGWNRDIDGPIRKVAYRYQCLDSLGREWGQPYFAKHPDKAKRMEAVS